MSRCPTAAETPISPKPVRVGRAPLRLFPAGSLAAPASGEPVVIIVDPYHCDLFCGGPEPPGFPPGAQTNGAEVFPPLPDPRPPPGFPPPPLPPLPPPPGNHPFFPP